MLMLVALMVILLYALDLMEHQLKDYALHQQAMSASGLLRLLLS